MSTGGLTLLYVNFPIIIDFQEAIMTYMFFGVWRFQSKNNNLFCFPSKFGFVTHVQNFFTIYQVIEENDKGKKNDNFRCCMPTRMYF